MDPASTDLHESNDQVSSTKGTLKFKPCVNTCCAVILCPCRWVCATFCKCKGSADNDDDISVSVVGGELNRALDIDEGVHEPAVHYDNHRVPAPDGSKQTTKQTTKQGSDPHAVTSDHSEEWRPAPALENFLNTIKGDEDSSEAEHGGSGLKILKQNEGGSHIEHKNLKNAREAPQEFTVTDFLGAINDQDVNNTQNQEGSNLKILKQNQEGSRSVHREDDVSRRPPMPLDVTRTVDPCWLLQDDDEETFRAKMPCGHAFSSDAIVSVVQNTLERNSIIFQCPATDDLDDRECNSVWDYSDIRGVACFTDEEKRVVEVKMANISLGLQKAKECPSCKTTIVKEHGDKNVRCPCCQYDFCWNCLQIWKPFDDGSCSNYKCTGKDERLEYLRLHSKIKDIYGVEAYDVRACPWCGVICQHMTGCKAMKCKDCQNNFCFVCLSKYDKEKGDYPCGYSTGYKKCANAPIQTKIPV